MVFINPAVVQAARVVMRQATDTALTIATSSTLAATEATFSSTSLSTPLPTTVVSTQPTTPPTDTSTLANGSQGGGSGSNGGDGGGGGGGGGGSSSSLLFFVALGFGVVFTNLWIIVGVKYCFRYNARNRQLRNEDGEPINMDNVPRPHRRRREKKLMPIDEVNEKFPMLQYKMWVAGRAQKGLPTRGGVSVPASRANSVQDADGIVPELPKDRMSTDGRPTTSPTATQTATESASDGKAGDAEKPQVQSPRHLPKESTSSTVGPRPRASTDSSRDPEGAVAQKHLSQFSHDEDDEDDHIDAALPPECLGTSGDTCAICIDTLEDDDYVRGLTCGHAFHASCIDPWLTTRRACCPLCKADYYTPKPRPQGAEGVDGTPGLGQATLSGSGRSGYHMNMPRRPRPLFMGFGPRRSRGHAGTSRSADNAISPVSGRAVPSGGPLPSSPDTPSTGPVGMLSSLRPSFSRFRFGRRQNHQQGQPEPIASGANTTTTPSQLEAGHHGP